MWLQQVESISQEEWDILDKTEKEEEKDALLTELKLNIKSPIQA